MRREFGISVDNDMIEFIETRIDYQDPDKPSNRSEAVRELLFIARCLLEELDEHDYPKQNWLKDIDEYGQYGFNPAINQIVADSKLSSERW